MNNSDANIAHAEEEAAHGTRATATIARIVSATINMLREQGHAGMTMLEVSHAAGVARGTLYRYFPDKTALLEKVTSHLGDQFFQALRDATEPYDEPDARLQAFIAFSIRYVADRQAERFLENEPEFIRRFQQKNFKRFVSQTASALTPVFDSWDARRATPIDRHLVSEHIVRLNLSEVLVPSARAHERLIRSLIAGLSGIDKG